MIRRPFRYSFYNAAFSIIGLNILVFILINVSQNTLGYLVLYPPAVVYRNAYWQFLTYMFAHANLTHLLFNMLGLFFFGVQVERRMGSSEFVLFYLITGIAAGVFSFIVYQISGSNTALLGASGAVYAVLLAYATYYPDSRIFVMGIIPVRAPVLVLVFTGIALFNQIFRMQSGVAHLTHLAGFLFAFIYFLARLGINPIQVFIGDGRHRWH